MVKVADLGYVSTNLEKIPSKEQHKKLKLEMAIKNLVGAKPPATLTRTTLPPRLGQGE